MSALLDLNDAALTLWDTNGSLCCPGYVRCHDDRYTFGGGAKVEARRHPREVSTRFWSQLNLQPLTPPLGAARHSADLVHGHLQHMLTERPNAELIIAAPGHMSHEQLALLLGILQTLPTTVVGVVHRSALIAAHSTAHTCLHVEAQLQQTILTPVNSVDGDMTAGDSITLPGFGWLWLLDQLADAVTAQFVEQTRFDPQRKANSEQLLYDALPELLVTLAAQGHTRLEIDGYTARLQLDHLQRVGEQWRATVMRAAGDLPGQWLLAGELCVLPGLATPDISLISEDSDWPPRVLEHVDGLRQEEGSLRLQSTCPLASHIIASAESPPVAPPSDAPKQLATHVLIDHRARRLIDGMNIAGDAHIVLSETGVGLSGPLAPDLLVNGQQASPGQVLAPGDVLSDSLGLEATLIHVEA